MKIQTFPCFGGPLDGMEVTEQYAGPDYNRYNRAARAPGEYHRIIKRPPRKSWRSVPKCVLVFLPWRQDEIKV